MLHDRDHRGHGHPKYSGEPCDGDGPAVVAGAKWKTIRRRPYIAAVIGLKKYDPSNSQALHFQV